MPYRTQASPLPRGTVPPARANGHCNRPQLGGGLLSGCARRRRPALALAESGKVCQPAPYRALRAH
jgi:hypothetical protein